MGRITDKAIREEEAIQEVDKKGCGAVVSFIGRVREMNRGKKVVEIMYECYDEMAERVLNEIELEAIERFGVHSALTVHRKGLLKPGEISVVIAVASTHRTEAFSACGYIIEEIKKRLPVWKKEVFEDGAEWVEGMDLLSDESIQE